MYQYRATMIRCIDGDTVKFDVDLGFNTHVLFKMRLRRIDAPELFKGYLVPSEKEKAIASRDHLAELCVNSGPLIIETHKDETDKYGRYLVEIYGMRGGLRININDQMVVDNHAVYMPEKKK